MRREIDYYLTHIHAPLGADLVEAAGLDSTGHNADTRFPYTWAGLTDAERGRIVGSVLLEGDESPTLEMSSARAVADAAQALADVLYLLEREHTAALDAVPDDDAREALRRAMEKGFPLGKALEEACGEAGDWATYLYEMARSQPPSVLSLVGAELADDQAALTDDARKREPHQNVDEVVRETFNGGLGGVTGRVGGTFTPVVLDALAGLIWEIHHHGDGRIRTAADEFARAYRAARHLSSQY
jgi:hypothetical protein